MKNILVLQHIAIEDPGYIKDLMEADGWNLVQIELDAGESIPPDLSGFDAMLCMGGPMDTWMEEEYPWLIEEKRRIHDWVVTMGKPFLGFCLGCQLLGEVLGGEIAKSEPPEIGVLDINMTRRGQRRHSVRRLSRDHQGGAVAFLRSSRPGIEPRCHHTRFIGHHALPDFQVSVTMPMRCSFTSKCAPIR